MSFLKQRIVGFVAHHTDRGPRSQAAITARNRAACDLTEQLLLSLRDSCASKNSILVATVVPQSLINTKQQMVTNLLGFMKAQGFHYVDLSPRFARTDGERTKLYYAVDGHWTASGHRLVAEVLCDFFAGSSLPNK
jgi:hypothetical protein